MSISAELARLEELYRRGALSEAEFTEAKRRVLADPGSASAPWVGRWRRSQTDRWVGGVCGGLAASTGTESWLWRLFFTLFVLLGGTGLLLYVLLWVFVPVQPETLPGQQRIAG